MHRDTAHNHMHIPPGDALIWSLAITGFWCLAEVLAGLYTNSLALLADAAHMLADLGALALSLFALKIGSRPASRQKTYGYLRAEILAALANGVFLGLAAAYIAVEAYQRLMAPPVVRSLPMLLVASIGLVANLATALLLYRSKGESLNIRGAFLHVLGDALGSVGAIAAGVAMVLWQWYLADPIFSIFVSILVLISAWDLIRESVDILLESAPRNTDIDAILRDLASARGVSSIHDLHVWSITSGMPAMSCHAVIHYDADASSALGEMSRIMREKHKIRHTTIQIEAEKLVNPE